ncbi:MAG: hypothetical protein O2971_18300 [Proteobacteria bacterium]|nr:hypothetical protein [Pseudomonadota bacterium]
MKVFTATRIIILGAIFSAGVSVLAQSDDAAIMQLISELANKPENHQSIAAYYKTKAEEARTIAGMHTEMKISYHDHRSGRLSGLAAASVAHCNRLIELNNSAAGEYEALAALHEGEAAR